MARGVGGGAVGACAFVVLAGWRWDQLGRGKAVIAAMNSAGVDRNFMEIYRTSMLPQTKFHWVPSGLNHSVMGNRWLSAGCGAWSCAGASEPLG